MIYGYNTPMDRSYIKSFADEREKVLDVDQVGIAMAMGIGARNVPEIASKIRAGASSLEIQFMGAGHGSQQGQTPGMFGKYHRQALRELSDANEVKITTHASVGIPGLAGQDQQGNFSDEARKMAMDEVNRAIDFAGEATKGGSVVVHTGEFQRPISEEPWAEEGKRFRGFEEEPERAIRRVVNSRTGQVLTQIRKNETVARPVWKTKKINGKEEYVDYAGNVVSRENRVPEYDPETGTLKVEQQGWDKLVKEAKELTEKNRREKGDKFDEERDTVTPEEAFLIATTEGQASVSNAWALQYSKGLNTLIEELNQRKSAKRMIEEELKKASGDKKFELQKRLNEIQNGNPSLGGRDTRAMSIKEIEREIAIDRDMVTGQLQQKSDQEKMRDNVMSTKKYALERSYEGYAQGGMRAWQETKDKSLENPLCITMENIYPESYGGHPDELKKLVLGSRKKMEEELIKKKGLSKLEAKEIAKTHIKATLDVGHLNMWRKYFDGNDKEFNKWAVKKTEELAKAGIVGNVHLADNFGYQDEHLAPGQGNAPIKDIVKALKKHKYDGPYTVECGSSATTDASYFHGLMKTWEYLGSPVYSFGASRDGLPPSQWHQIQGSYFGQTYPPSFMFGNYVPSNEWTLWTGVPME
jgi:hypothetical protein